MTSSSDGGRFPDIAKQLKFFQTSFNREQAKKAGVIVPSPGVDVAYDSSIAQIKAMEIKLQEYLTKQKKRLASQVSSSWFVKVLYTTQVSMVTEHSVLEQWSQQVPARGTRGRAFSPHT